jgi:ABC-type glutathione transport system ATPase component
MRLRATRRSSLVLVTHDLSVVARICERVLVMQDGRIVEEGRVGDVFAHPKTDYARLLLSASLDIGRTAPVRPLEQAPPLLEARGLQYSYRSAGLLPRLSRAPIRPAFKDVALSLGRGEVLGVIGESGSGKTTLALTVAGLMRPSGGTLEFDSRSIASVSKHRAPELRRRIQMVFQDPLSSLNPRHTVGHAIARPLELYFGLSRRAALQRAAQHLAELGMTADLLARFPRQLSGGQQQRVAIARAFAVEPDLLICDEITSALDAAVQAQVLDLLLAQQQLRRTAMLLVTHDLSVIWKMAARVIVLKDGGIVEQGITSQVFGNPSDAYTRSLLDAALAVTAMAPGQEATLTLQTMENRDAH